MFISLFSGDILILEILYCNYIFCISDDCLVIGGALNRALKVRHAIIFSGPTFKSFFSKLFFGPSVYDHYASKQYKVCTMQCNAMKGNSIQYATYNEMSLAHHFLQLSENTILIFSTLLIPTPSPFCIQL